MRQRFESDLGTFNEIAKEGSKKEKSERDEDEGEVDLDSVLEFHLKKIAERQHTSVDAQRKVYVLQKSKQEVMQWLKEKLRSLDDPKQEWERTEGARDLEYNEEKRRFVYSLDNGKKRTATIGQVLTDMDWGVEYNMNDSVPRSMAKRYFVRQARKKLEELLDKQIIQNEIDSDTTDYLKKSAYRRIGEERESGQVMERTGVLSETIIKNFLEKACIDHNLPFRIVDADVFEDVEHKIDLVIEVEDRSRGVDVEESQDAKEVSVSQKNYGIQFSINPESEVHKLGQIKRAKGLIQREQAGRQKNIKHRHTVDDIFLVIFPLNISRDMKENWQNTGRIAGGPSSFMYQQTAEPLLKGLLKGIFTEEKIDEFWQKIKNDFLVFSQ